MGDLNEHVQGPTITTFAESLNLQEAITQQHLEAQGFVPTWQRGNDPIDVMFDKRMLDLI